MEKKQVDDSWLWGEIEKLKFSPEVITLNKEQEFKLVKESLENPEAFVTLMKATYGKIVNTLVRNFGYEQFDIAGIYKKAYSRLDTFKFRSSFSTWVCVIALNHYRDLFRKRHTKVKGVYDKNGHIKDPSLRRNYALLLYRPSMGTHKNTYGSKSKVNSSHITRDNLEIARHIARNSFNQLNNEEKHLLQEGLLLEKKYLEMARELNCSVNTVRIRIHKARKKLIRLYHRNAKAISTSNIITKGYNEDLQTKRKGTRPFPGWVSPYPPPKRKD